MEQVVDLVVDQAALDRAAATLRSVAASLRHVPVATTLADVPGALPASDVGAACVEAGRLLQAWVLAYALAIDGTAAAVAAATHSYQLTDVGLAAAAGAVA